MKTFTTIRVNKKVRDFIELQRGKNECVNDTLLRGFGLIGQRRRKNT